MSEIRRGTCGMPGPYGAHCTDHPMHSYSCYDASEDVSFNSRQGFRHDCSDPKCTTQHFTNEES